MSRPSTCLWIRKDKLSRKSLAQWEVARKSILRRLSRLSFGFVNLHDLGAAEGKGEKLRAFHQEERFHLLN